MRELLAVAFAAITAAATGIALAEYHNRQDTQLPDTPTQLPAMPCLPAGYILVRA